jgi:hypothetical protein
MGIEVIGMWVRCQLTVHGWGISYRGDGNIRVEVTLISQIHGMGELKLLVFENIVTWKLCFDYISVSRFKEINPDFFGGNYVKMHLTSLVAAAA